MREHVSVCVCVRVKTSASGLSELCRFIGKAYLFEDL
jgi:hypothetical protein